MRSQTEEAVTGWDREPFSGGYGGLHEFADREFTGAVTQGSTWAFLLNGRIVGVADGTIEAFDGADGTAYVAPDDALPLLFAMKERGGEVRAQYYTNDTPLSEVDETLSSGGFTGYLELSENVLSGDYYVVYYGGKSMTAAFVGNNRELVAGEEAFERADDEVGIYEVRDVDVDIVDVPEPAGDDASDAAGAANAAGAAGSADTAGDVGQTTDAEAATDDVDAEPEVGSGSTGAPSEGTSSGTEASSPVDDADGATESAPDRSGTADAADAARSGGTADPTDARPDRSEETEGAGAESEPRTGVRTPPDESPFADEAQWRETTSVPALDPENSATEPEKGDRSGKSGRSAAARTGATESAENAESAEGGSDRSRQRGSSGSRSGSGSGSGSGAPSPDRRAAGRASRSRAAGDDDGTTDGAQAAELRERVEALREARDEAERERDELAGERDRYREEVERLKGRIEELEAEVDRLESELEGLSAAGGAGAAADGPSLSSEKALRETNLFVRYQSKSGGTLEKAHAGEATQGEVNDNLRVEHHTRFEAETATVDGRPFDGFLTDTIEYGFVRWVVGDLLYEIGETGNGDALADLFDAIPEIDRAELHGEVSLVYEDEGKEQREQETFDVVFRDRMGNPLLVANVNDSREPTPGEAMESLVERSERLKESNESLGGAFAVTASYFEPDALEAAQDATGGGLFSRGKKLSYVRLSRKRGYHLCLVETREGNFHLNVPEL